MVDREAFREALASVARVAREKSPWPLMGCVLIRDGWLTCSDMETWISARFDIDGEACVPAGLLLDVLTREDADEIDVAFTDGGLKIKGSANCRVHGYDPSDFVTPPEGDVVSLAKGADLSGVRRIAWCALPEVQGGTITGVYLDFQKGNVTATNRHMLATTPVPQGQHSLLVTRRSANLLGGTYNVSRHRDMGVFEGVGIVIATRLMEGEYPDTSFIRNTAHSGTLTLDRASFLGALRRVNVFARANDKLLKRIVLDVGEEVSLSSENEEAGAARESVVCERDGKSAKLTFTADYLVRSVSSLTSDTLTLSYGEGPACITGGYTRFYILPQRAP